MRQPRPAFHLPLPLNPLPLTHLPHTAKCPIKMSGVNGGIDYTLNLSTLPPPLASRIHTIQNGPDSPTALITAATEIASHAPSYPQTLPVLVDMLGFNNPVAANIAVDALCVAGTAAIPYLLRGVAAFNYSVNAYALRALGRIGDASVEDVVTACALRGPIPNVRRAGCRALGMLRYEDGRKAFEALIGLVEGEEDWGVRYAAVVAVEGFVGLGVAELWERAERALEKVGEGVGGEGVDEVVRARAVLAAGRLRERVGGVGVV